jgi:hypothetical protein
LSWFVNWNRLPLVSLLSCCESILLLLWLWACGQRFSVVQAKRHVHSRFVKRGDAFAPHRHRRSIAQRLVKAPFIVEINPFSDAGACLAASFIAFDARRG